MKFVEWCEMFVIGDAVIDRQHRELFDIANRFVADVSYGQADRKRAFVTLNELTRYAQDHFPAEEEAARRHGYPEDDLRELSKSHEELLEAIFDVNTQLSKQESLDLSEIIDFLTEWLVMHVLVEDRKIKRFIA